jgi:aldose 1-epimerase
LTTWIKFNIMKPAALPEKKNFQQTMDGKQTDLFILKNKNGLQAAITNYGARLVSLLVPGKDGNLYDVVVGFDSVKGYKDSEEPYYGATIGRYANRIAKGKFILEGREYKLATNNGPNHLHGGVKGFQDVVWDAVQPKENCVELYYTSVDGEEGFPGNVDVKVVYTLTDENELKIGFEATTDKTTIINLTNHAYFNLNGQGSGNILKHLLRINADGYTPIDETSIPLGKIEPVAETPFDFREPVAIGERIDADDEQIKNGGGYDHNFALNKSDNDLSFAAAAIGDISGVEMEVYTMEPGIQLYTGNFMAAKHQLKEGHLDERRSAFCLETQHYPDSPNHPSFPSTVLQPGETYATTTIYRFAAAK